VHPADNILIFSFKNGVKLFVDGHWKYKSNGSVIVSHLAGEESVEDNFSKIEDLAEDISKKNLSIGGITWDNDDGATLIFNNEDKLIVSVHSYKDEYLLMSLAFSSGSDDAHIHIDYENKQWIQYLACMEKKT